MARSGSRRSGGSFSDPNTAVLKTPGKQAVPVSGGTGIVKPSAAKAATARPSSGLPGVVTVKGRVPVEKTQSSNVDRNK